MGIEQISHVEHRVPDTGVWRPGSTSHEESGTDLECYQRPLERVHGAALHDWGVASGLSVLAVPGSVKVRITPGVALDAAGRHIVLAPGGQAETSADPDQSSRLVVVAETGAELSTLGLTGDCLLTVQWRETFDRQLLDDTFQQTFLTRHTPWLRVQPTTADLGDGLVLVLATLTLDAASGVIPGGAGVAGRRGPAPQVGGLRLRSPQQTTTPAGVTITDTPTAELAVRADGDVELSLLGGTGPRTALTIEHATGATHVAGGLRVTGDATFTTAQFRDLSTDNLSVAGDASFAGARFGDIAVAGLSVSGEAWFAAAHFGDVSASNLSASGLLTSRDVAADNVDVAWMIALGGQVALTADSYLRLNQNGAFGGGVHTPGLFSAGSINIGGLGGWGSPGFGNLGVAGGVTVAGVVDAFQYQTNGQSWLRGQVYTGELFGHWDSRATLRLFGSSIWDGGDAWLQLQSGGGRTYLRGEVTVEGKLNKPGGGFRIDHPLHPEDQYLSHSFVESPEMINLYAGTAVTDEEGRATVTLPDYFDALNRDHRFQLTTLGQLALVTVEGEVRDSTFTIRTDRPGVTVSWQVTGVRQDPWAEAHRIVVVEEKPDQEQSLFLHPELYGEPQDRAFLSSPAPPVSFAQAREPSRAEA